MLFKLICVLFLTIQILSKFVISSPVRNNHINDVQTRNFELVMKSYERLLNDEPNEANYIKLYIMNLWLKEFVKNELKRRIVQTSTYQDWYLRQG